MIIIVCVALQLKVRYQLKCDDSCQKMLFDDTFYRKRDTAIIKKN